MCGIIGYTGRRHCLPILMEGLKRLEYRGYDSAGVAVVNGEGLALMKQAGKIRALEETIRKSAVRGTFGIAHTRWATHGEPSQANAHPHLDGSSTIAVVHNGIIENYAVLKKSLEHKGHVFRSQTDTEVLAHLIGEHFDGCSLERAVASALAMVKGTYGIAVISSREPGKIVGARNGSPLVVGVGKGENFVASDVAAILAHTREVIYLGDGEMVVITPDQYRTMTVDEMPIAKHIEEISWDLEQIERSGYPHFMKKEIFEQAEAMRNTMRGRLLLDEGIARLGGPNLTPQQLRQIRRIIITACGTSWHAGMIGEYMIEDLCRIPVEVEYASEFRYRNPIVQDGTLVIAISQSGETADTLAALREAKRKGAPALGIVNVVGSTVARESDGGVYIHAGPEIGVASTKAFTCQVVALALLTLWVGRHREMSLSQGRRMVEELWSIPDKVQRVLDNEAAVVEIAKQMQHDANALYLGRGYNYPVALEGALKLKEISYIHAEGYPAAEMKHGPIALIDENMPVVFVCTRDSAYEKIMSNIQEVRARKGRIIAVASEGDREIASMADHVVYVPHTLEPFTPLVSVIPLQLLAYHIAVLRGCNVDQPRNLAKSVTVE
jgi:glucosamine--fructose-6-phosphate aminotransferase (isomerizing)